MTLRYIANAKNTFLYEDANTNDWEFKLLFGDEVDTTGNQDNNREEVQYRGRLGWVRSDRLSPNRGLELYAIDVGQGDSTFIVTPGGRTILVDGGRGAEAFQFLVWKYRLDVPGASTVDIDLLILSHADDDHIAGLVSIINHPLINVREVVHSGIAKYRAGVHTTSLGDTIGAGANRRLVTRHDQINDLNRADLTNGLQNWFDAVVQEQANGMLYRAVDSTTGQINTGDPGVQLHVLGPRLDADPNHPNGVYRWLSSAGKTVNGHSVVIRLDIGNVRILLPGDINEGGADHLMGAPGFAAEADAHVFKAPHHGSHDFSDAFLAAVNPQITVVSSGETPDHGHPRANFLGAVGHRSRSDEPLLFSTELVALFTPDPVEATLDADNPADPTNAAMLGQARRRFLKRLNGLINVRTDGQALYAARRVAASPRVPWADLDQRQ